MATAAKPNSTVATTTGAKRKPVFVKVEDLKPGTNGHTLTVKVVSAQAVVNKGPNAGGGGRSSSAPLSSRPRPRIAECLVGDETGTIIFTARNEQSIKSVPSFFPFFFHFHLFFGY